MQLSRLVGLGLRPVGAALITALVVGACSDEPSPSVAGGGGGSGAGGAATGGKAAGGGSGGSAAGGTSGSGGQNSSAGAGSPASAGQSAGGTSGEGGEPATDAGAGGSGAEGGSASQCALANGGLALVAENAWIDPSTNCVGVGGYVLAHADSEHVLAPGFSTITLEQTDGTICVSGTAKDADDSPNNTGATVVIMLDYASGVLPEPYVAADYGVVGFELDISGAMMPALYRLQYQEEDDSGVLFCKELTGAGHRSALFSETHPECWTGADSSTPDTSDLRQLQIQIPSISGADVSFAFCVDNVLAMK